MLKNILLSTALSLVLQTEILAGELDQGPNETSITVPFDWNGRYGGLQVGVGDQYSQYTIGAIGLVSSANPTGVIAGGFAGYNWHAGKALIGIEADANYVSAKSPGVGFIPVTFTTSAIASLRARFGVTKDNLLLFGTLGGAYMKTSHRADAFGATFDIDDSGFTTTWGAGFEMAFKNNTTLRIEYRHLDEISENHAQITKGQSVLGAHSASAQMDMVTIGLSKYF